MDYIPAFFEITFEIYYKFLRMFWDLEDVFKNLV
jgi:hypothetical protein